MPESRSLRLLTLPSAAVVSSAPGWTSALRVLMRLAARYARSMMSGWTARHWVFL